MRPALLALLAVTAAVIAVAPAAAQEEAGSVLGVVFHEILCAVHIPADVPAAPLPRLRGLGPNVRLDYRQSIPAAFIPVIQRALEPVATDRPKDARAFAADLKVPWRNTRTRQFSIVLAPRWPVMTR